MEIIAIVTAVILNTVTMVWVMTGIVDRLNQVEYNLHERMNVLLPLLLQAAKSDSGLANDTKARAGRHIGGHY